jgi:CubicO group peptidase (beta-lactamase class C family)
MMSDHITPEQKAVSPFFPGFWDRHGWGFGGAIVTSGPRAGRYGWAGGFGTTMRIDPRARMVTIVLTQRLMRGPEDAAIGEEVQALAYRADGG